MTRTTKEFVPEDAEIFTGTRGGKYFYRIGDHNGDRIYIINEAPPKRRRSFKPRTGRFTAWLERQKDAV